MSKNKAKNKQSNAVAYLETSLQDVSRIVIFVLLTIFPLLPGTNGVYYNITKSKFVYFVIIMLLYIGAVIFFWAKECKNVKAAGGKLFKKPSITQWFVIAYMVWSLISACVSKYGFWACVVGHSRYEALLSIWLYGILFLLIAQFGIQSDGSLYGLTVMSLIMGVICTFQSLGAKLLYPGDYNYFNSRFLGTIGHEDCYSNIISLLIPALCAIYVFSDDNGIDGSDEQVSNGSKTPKIMRILTLPAIVTLFFVQCVSDVDCGKIGLLAAFIVALPFVIDTFEHAIRFIRAASMLTLGYSFFCLFEQTKPNQVVTITATKRFVFFILVSVVLFMAGWILEKKKPNGRFIVSQKTMRIIIVAVLIVGIIAALFFVSRYQGGNKLIQEASQLMHGELSDTMGTGRGKIWKGAVEIIKDNPIFGIGPGTFLTEANSRGLSFATSQIDQAHNDFLQIASCQGLVGLIIYLAFVVSLLVRGIKLAIKDNISALYTIGIIGFLGAVFFVFSIAIVSPLYWVFAGLLENRMMRFSTEKDSD